MLDLGHLYLEKQFGKVDHEKAKQFFTMAANTGDTGAICLLGKYYVEGRFGEKDIKTGNELIKQAITLWTARAEKNDLDAIHSLAKIYQNPLYDFRDLIKASTWLRLSLKLGVKKGLPDLAKLHLHGLQYDLPAEDYALEIKEFKSLADKDYPSAIAALAAMYKATLLEKDKKDGNENPWAIKLEKLLKEEGQTKSLAASFLGRLYKEGTILPQHLGEATKWLFQASVLPEPPDSCIEELDKLLYCKTLTSEEKKQIIDTLIDIGTKQKEEAPFRIGRILGDAYRLDRLVKPDYEKALFWYEKSAKLDNAKAMVGLGLLYQSGKMGKKDYEKAVMWYDLSAKKGNNEAIRMLLMFNKIEGPEVEAGVKTVIEPWLKQFEEFTKRSNTAKEKVTDNIKPSI
jgi:TPR repeat protein